MYRKDYYGLGFGENVNYYTYHKKLCVKSVVLSEVLCLKQSKLGYFAFQSIDSLKIKWYLPPDISAGSHIENKKEEIMM